MPEQFENNYSTLLNGAIDDNDTTIVVDTAPDTMTGSFRIKIGDELILVGSVSGTSFTGCTRGIEGTTATSHADNAPVTHVLTAGSLQQAIEDAIIPWTQDVNESGASASNWTAHGGTWSSNGTELIQTDTGASWRKFRYNAAEIKLGYTTILEAEMQVVSGSGGTQRVGIGTTDSTGGGNGISVNIDIATNSLAIDKDNSATVATHSATYDASIWYKVTVVTTVGGVSVYVDDTHVKSALLTNQGSWNAGAYLVLYSYGVSSKFRNINVWTLQNSTNAPLDVGATGEEILAADTVSEAAEAIELRSFIPIEFDPLITSDHDNGWSTLIPLNSASSCRLSYLQSSGSQNSELSFDSYTFTAGTYTVDALVFKNNNHGIMHVQVDGTDLTTFDTYNSSALPDQRMTATSLSISAGAHTISIQMSTKNGSSSNYYGLLNKLIFRRTA